MDGKGEQAIRVRRERGTALYLVGGGADWEVELAPMGRTVYTIGRDQADEDGGAAKKVE